MRMKIDILSEKTEKRLTVKVFCTILKCEGTADSVRFFLFAQETEVTVRRVLMGYYEHGTMDSMYVCSLLRCMHICIYIM